MEQALEAQQVVLFFLQLCVAFVALQKSEKGVNTRLDAAETEESPVLNTL